MKEPGNRVTREAACRKIAEQVGMSYVNSGMGWDNAIVQLAESVMYDKHDILQRPRRVASEITSYLDDLVKNP